mmetsp:Transcript_13287/g.28398  ORF Transcript_13287/g.28398 Transcript_13287/m.28398 type:complete len:206 (-) Transcript_13287:1050-1667(-)
MKPSMRSTQSADDLPQRARPQRKSPAHTADGSAPRVRHSHAAAGWRGASDASWSRAMEMAASTRETAEVRPSRSSMRKKATQKSPGNGISDSASGITSKTRPGPAATTSWIGTPFCLLRYPRIEKTHTPPNSSVPLLMTATVSTLRKIGKWGGLYDAYVIIAPCPREREKKIWLTALIHTSTAGETWPVSGSTRSTKRRDRSGSM